MKGSIMKGSLGVVVASAVVVLAAGALATGVAHAQSTPTTCGMLVSDLIVSVNGRTTTVESGPGGVLVNGAFCAWPDEIASVQVWGGALNDRVTLRGSFTPGDAAEPDWDELEVVVTLGGGADTVTLELSGGNDLVLFSSEPDNSLWLNNDADTDFQVANDVEVFKLMGMGGDDTLFAEASTIPTLYLYGGDGNDSLTGSDVGDDILEGDAGNDYLFGAGGNDLVDGGPGSDDLQGSGGFDTVDYRARTAPVFVTVGDGASNDGEAGELDNVGAGIYRVLGGKGNDVLTGSPGLETLEGGAGNDVLDGGLGGDTLIGGPGNDTADYSSRTTDLYVDINMFSDDGEAFELDFVDATVENVTGGSGNDFMVGSAFANILRGGGGNDNLTGEGGNDTLYGDAGDDSLLGGLGADKLYGGAGGDVLDGEAGADTFTAGGGNDFLYNNDGVAETVNCGPGNADDAEVDTGATDTFIGCEL